MKKTIRIFAGVMMLVALTVSLIGCGGGGGNNPTPTPTPTPTTPTPLITQGLTGYYPFNNGAAVVGGGTAGNGVLTGGVTATTDRFTKNQALSLNGIDGKIVIPAVPSSGTALTIAFWVKINNPSAVQYFVLWSGGGKSIGIGTNNGAPLIAISTPTTNSASATSIITNNTWVHVAVTYDGTTAKVFYNGSEEGSAAIQTSLSFNGRDVTIGVFNSTYWAGSLDDFYIFDRVLSNSEIGQLANQH